jgi:protein YIPF5/7
MTVLNPLQQIDEHIMDDADMAGPIIFCFSFATFLLLVSRVLFAFPSRWYHEFGLTFE